MNPHFTGVEAGLSAVGDIFEAIARLAATDVKQLSRGLEEYRAGQTGLLRLTWDNGEDVYKRQMMGLAGSFVQGPSSLSARTTPSA